MRDSSNYSEFLEKLVTEDVVPKSEERKKLKKDLDDAHSETLLYFKKQYGIFILALFCLSYVVLFIAVYIVFKTELELIKTNFMDASERSINSTVISALVAGTVTQTGICFMYIVRQFFKKN